MAGERFAVSSEQIRAHARNVETVRDRFAAVQTASAAISQDDAAYGLLCGWIAAVLAGRHARQDELFAYVEENLTLAAAGLRRTRRHLRRRRQRHRRVPEIDEKHGGYGTDPPVTDASLVAGVRSTRKPWTGSGLANGVHDLVDAIDSGSWVDEALAGVCLLGPEIVSDVLDPFEALFSNGFGWAMEHFAPLREILDKLTGIPDQVAADANTWNNMAQTLDGMATELGSRLVDDTPAWRGQATEAYQSVMGNNVDALGGLAGISAAMSSATQAAGNLVQFTREIVRDLIADLVDRAVTWLIEAIFVVTIPVAVAQITAAVAKWVGRIFTYVTALVTSLTNLKALLNG